MSAKFHVTPLRLAGPLLVRPPVFADDRGFFIESYREPLWHEHGISCPFVQDNHSRSLRGTLRGMHFQTHPGQAKLVRVARGSIFDVVVDMRPDSPTCGQWEGVTLDDQSHTQIFVPVGFAHGFCVLSELADVVYKVSSVYNPATEAGFRWNDPSVGIVWPLTDPIVSKRDHEAQSFAQALAALQERSGA